MKCLTCKYCDLYVGDEISLKGTSYCHYFNLPQFQSFPIFFERLNLELKPHKLIASQIESSKYCKTYDKI